MSTDSPPNNPTDDPNALLYGGDTAAIIRMWVAAQLPVQFWNHSARPPKWRLIDPENRRNLGTWYRIRP